MRKRPQVEDVLVVFSSYLGGSDLLSFLNDSNGITDNSSGKSSKAPVTAGAWIRVALSDAGGFAVWSVLDLEQILYVGWEYRVIEPALKIDPSLGFFLIGSACIEFTAGG